MNLQKGACFVRPSDPMFPWHPQPSLQVGGIRLYAFGILVAVAVVVGIWMTIVRTRRRGLDGGITIALCAFVTVGGFVGAHVLKLAAYEPVSLLGRPQHIMHLLSGIASFGGIFGGLACALLFKKLYAVPGERLWEHLDVMAYVFPLALGLGRAGCALAHDHPGVPTSSWLAVQYPGGARYDLGLLGTC